MARLQKIPRIGKMENKAPPRVAYTDDETFLWKFFSARDNCVGHAHERYS